MHNVAKKVPPAQTGGMESGVVNRMPDINSGFVDDSQAENRIFIDDAANDNFDDFDDDLSDRARERLKNWQARIDEANAREAAAIADTWRRVGDSDGFPRSHLEYWCVAYRAGRAEPDDHVIRGVMIDRWLCDIEFDNDPEKWRVLPDVTRPLRHQQFENIVARDLGEAMKHLVAQPRKPIPPPVEVDPWAPNAVEGVMRLYFDFVMSTARKPVPEFAMMAAATFMATLYGRSVLSPVGVALNIYTAILGTSAYGKDAPLASLSTVADATGLTRFVRSGDISSRAGIAKRLRKQAVFTYAIDELGELIQAINGKNAAPWTRSIRKALLELHSKSRSRWNDNDVADDKVEDIPYIKPCLSLMGASTPTTFYDGLTAANLMDGFLGRLLVIQPSTRPDSQDAPVAPVPPALVKAITDIGNSFAARGNLYAVNRTNVAEPPSQFVVPYADDDARAAFAEVETWKDDMGSFDPSIDGLTGRAGENTIKLATFRALSRSGWDAAVTVDDIQWGWAITYQSIRTVLDGVETYMAGSADEALRKAIVRELKGAQGMRLPKSVLKRRPGVSSADTQQFDRAILGLKHADLIQEAGSERRQIYVLTEG